MRPPPTAAPRTRPRLRFGVLPCVRPYLLLLAASAAGVPSQKVPAQKVPGQKAPETLEQFSKKVAPGTIQREFLDDARFQDDAEVYLFAPQHPAHESFPLVVLLHGNNQPPQNFLRHCRLLSDAEAPAFVLAPRYQRQVGGRFETVEDPLALFDAALDHTLERYPVDRARVVLMGFSRGSGYAQRWLDTLASRDEPLPFREVWSCGGATCPEHPTPRVPHLLLVGENETAVLGRLDIRSSVRETFATMIDRGFDATYLEAPGMDHRVDPRCLEIMRGRLAALDPWPRIADAEDLADLPEIADAIARERIDLAWDAVDAVIDGDATRLKGPARRVGRALAAFVDDRAEHLAAAATLAAHDELAGLVDSLASRPRTARAAAKALASLAEDPGVARELRARKAYRAASALPAEEARQAALIALADDEELGATDYGQRAQSHLQALGLAYTSPQVPALGTGKD